MAKAKSTAPRKTKGEPAKVIDFTKRKNGELPEKDYEKAFGAEAEEPAEETREPTAADRDLDSIDALMGETAAPVKATPAPAPVGVLGPFTNLTTNLKGGGSVALGPLTAIVGKNRSGKTGIGDAIIFGLTGTHGIGVSSVMALAPAGEPSLFVKLSNAQGRLTRKADGGNITLDAEGAFQGLPPEALKNAVPAVALAELLTFGPGRAREAMIRRFGELGDTLPTPLLPGEGDKALWAQALEATKPERGEAADTAERLASIAKWLRAEKLRLGKDVNLKAAELERKSVQVRQHGEVSDEMLADAEAAYQQALSYENYFSARSKLKGLEEERTRLREVSALLPPNGPSTEESDLDRPEEPDVTSLQAKEQELQEKLQEIADKESLAKMLLQVIDKSIEHQACVTCGGTFEFNGKALPERRAQVAEKLAQRRTEKEKLAKTLSTVSQQIVELVNDHETKLMEWRRKRSEDAAKWNSFTTRAAANKQARATLEEVLAAAEAQERPSEDTVITSNDARERLEALKVAKVGATALEPLDVEVRAAEAKRDLAGRLGEETGKLLLSLLGKVKLKAEAGVNRFMPAGFLAKIALEDNGKPTCRWEVMGADGTPHRRGAACGSEWASLATALSIAWVQGSPIRIPVLDDETLGVFDPENFKGLLAALEKAQKDGAITQAVVVTTRAAEIPKNWIRVER